MSDSLLQRLNASGGLRVGGLRWQGDAPPRSIQPSALTAKILCGWHNSALSTFDSIAVRLFESLDSAARSAANPHEIRLFSGHDVERWMLKVLCGLAASKGFDIEGCENIPDKWVRILFGEDDFKPDQGLYMCRSKGSTSYGPLGVVASAVIGNKQLSGLGLLVNGFELVISMNGWPDRRFDNRDFAYRPLELLIDSGFAKRSVFFSWNGPADKGTITTVDWRPSGEAALPNEWPKSNN